MENKPNPLIKIRKLAVAISSGVILLALQSLWTGQVLFQYFALGLTIFALVFLTVMIARAVKERDADP